MWGDGGSKFKSAKVDTLIGHNTELQGNIVYKGGLHVDGTIVGDVVAEDDSGALLILSERGRVEGDVRVPNVLLNGEVVGDVHSAERIELAGHAKVNGNVYYNLLEMTMGAQINGNMVHKKKQEKRLLEHKNDERKDEQRASGQPPSSPAPEGANS